MTDLTTVKPEISHEVEQLQRHATQAIGHPLLPAPARHAVAALVNLVVQQQHRIERLEDAVMQAPRPAGPSGNADGSAGVAG